MKRRDTVRFIDPFTDFAFKKIFGSEPNKGLLLAFLNALFEGRKAITEVRYMNTEYYGREKGSRTVIFDILCTGDQGELFLIEMQKIGQEYFKDRCIYYTSSLICSQVRKGDKQGWGYQLKETYLIGLMDFSFDDTAPDRYIHDVQLVDKYSGSVFYDRLGYIFIEIPKFDKPATALDNAMDQWLYVLKHLHRMEKIPVFLRKSVFAELFKIAEMSNLSASERMAYDVSLKRKWDWQNSLAYAKKKAAEQGWQEGMEQGREEGMKKGIKEGMKQGVEQGMEQGMKQGMKQGVKETQRRIARNFKAEGIPIGVIASATGLTAAEVEKL